MQHQDMTATLSISDYGIEHIDVDCFVGHEAITATINAFHQYLTPFQPAHIIHLADTLYYQIIDHCTDQEITMQQAGYPDSIEHKSIHSNAIELLGSIKHSLLFADIEAASEFISALQDWSKTHQQHEQKFMHYQEAQRFRQ